jgi:hypothetical protein
MTRSDLPQNGQFVVFPRWAVQWTLGMLASVLSATLGVVWYTATYVADSSSRLTALERQAEGMVQATAARHADRDRLTVVEQQIINIRQSQDLQFRVLERIENRLERMYQNGGNGRRPGQ